MIPVFETVRLQIYEASMDMLASERSELLLSIPPLLTSAVVANLPPYFSGIDSKATAHAWLERMLRDSRLFLVKSKSDVLIGFLFASSEKGHDAHIGYLLSEDTWGKGFGTELLQGFIEYVPQSTTWDKLIGGVSQDNAASAHLLKKLGFVEQPGRSGNVVFYEYTVPRQLS
ncbi:GNAT family N-acetyltransferase [Endozoicomonas sp.]|uniref:GNAT family N-acetyltransferase n=1 Tax=Endozoicomonas sp. TaxID=1892382 RepID=UPI003AF88027